MVLYRCHCELCRRDFFGRHPREEYCLQCICRALRRAAIVDAADTAGPPDLDPQLSESRGLVLEAGLPVGP